VNLAQGMDVLASEGTKVAARGMDELRPIYDATCKKHDITDEALSGRGCQMVLYVESKEHEPSELSVLMLYLLDKGVAMRDIIANIKCATPEIYKQALALRIEQSTRYKQQQTARVVGVMA